MAGRLHDDDDDQVRDDDLDRYADLIDAWDDHHPRGYDDDEHASAASASAVDLDEYDLDVEHYDHDVRRHPYDDSGRYVVDVTCSTLHRRRNAAEDRLMDERLRIPTAYASPCELCGEILDVRAVGVHQWTSGWVARREGGGGHGVSLPIRERRWAHRRCVEREAAGLARQESLLG